MRLILAQNAKAKFRVWVGDGSGATYEESGLVEEGIIQLASWEGRDWPITTLYQAAEGYFPADPLDPKSALVKPTPESLEHIMLWAFEGLSVGAQYVMGDAKGGLAYRAGKGEKLGQDAPFRIVDGPSDAKGNPTTAETPVYGGNPLAHYGVAQRRILGWIERAKALPGEFMVMTAHERAAEDKLTKENVIGPEVGGSALTPTIQRMFGNTLHFVTVEKRSKEKDDFTQKLVDDLDVRFRLYTRDHVSGTTGQKFKAITRGGLTTFMEKDPKTGKEVEVEEMPLFIDSPRPGDSIEEFYQRLAAARIRRKVATKEAA